MERRHLARQAKLQQGKQRGDTQTIDLHPFPNAEADLPQPENELGAVVQPDLSAVFERSTHRNNFWAQSAATEERIEFLGSNYKQIYQRELRKAQISSISKFPSDEMLDGIHATALRIATTLGEQHFRTLQPDALLAIGFAAQQFVLHRMKPLLREHIEMQRVPLDDDDVDDIGASYSEVHESFHESAGSREDEVQSLARESLSSSSSDEVELDEGFELKHPEKREQSDDDENEEQDEQYEAESSSADKDGDEVSAAIVNLQNDVDSSDIDKEDEGDVVVEEGEENEEFEREEFEDFESQSKSTSKPSGRRKNVAVDSRDETEDSSVSKSTSASAKKRASRVQPTKAARGGRGSSSAPRAKAKATAARSDESDSDVKAKGTATRKATKRARQSASSSREEDDDDSDEESKAPPRKRTKVASPAKARAKRTSRAQSKPQSSSEGE